nr:amino acid adenylation domain-containing protein [Deinococcus betulae]
MARTFVRAVAQLLGRAALQSPACALPLLSDEAHAEVAALGRSAAAPARPTARLDEAFTRQAAACPDAPALSCEDQTLRYGELNGRADAVARALRAHGLKDHERVGVCLERSLDLVVVLLGILKAGGTYVPMDPTYPRERLQHTVTDAQVRLVVTDLPNFPLAPDGQALAPDAVSAYGATLTAPLPAPTTTAEDAAYVIFTSGSTGKPKGVAVPHANVGQLIAVTRDDFGLGPNDTWTMFHSASFDFSVWEIWGALLTGGHLVVVPYWVSRDPAEFHDLLRERRVTVLNQTPSAFTQLIEADRTRPPLGVRLVIFGGEPLHAPVLLRWFDRYPERHCRLVNMFGITETTVHVTALTVRRREALQASRSVGPALPGWHLYVMDAQQRLLPPGVPGEIYVGGDGVALGYLNRDELTRERFLPDPFAPGRMYRSGDKGRLRLDGQLEHLGRLDSQVKLRGFRIELEEIRHVLMGAPHVTAAAVVVHQPDPNDSASARLDAYVTLDAPGPAQSDLGDVRRHAAQHLPPFMQPATFTRLNHVPLTANGKLDVRRLPPAQPPRAPDPDVAAPSRAASAEEVLRQLFEQVLSVPVGLDDNFFELGGNSLYAVRISALLRERGLPALPLRELYVHQTVRRLAPFIALAAAGPR